MRLGRGRSDFCGVARGALGLSDLAGRVQTVNPYADGLERREPPPRAARRALAAGAGR
jgi:hypothetical protein